MNMANVAASTTILAIDLGKYKSVVCILDESSDGYRFTTFDTSRGELFKLLAREQPGGALIEACLVAGWVFELCNEVGVCRGTSLEAFLTALWVLLAVGTLV